MTAKLPPEPTAIVSSDIKDALTAGKIQREFIPEVLERFQRQDYGDLPPGGVKANHRHLKAREGPVYGFYPMPESPQEYLCVMQTRPENLVPRIYLATAPATRRDRKPQQPNPSIPRD